MFVEFGEVEIDGWESDGASDLCALGDGRDKLVGACEREAGVEDTALTDQPANERGTDRRDGAVCEADCDFGFGDRFKAHFLSELCENVHITLTFLSETKILPFDDGDRVIVLQDDVQERLGRQVENFMRGLERFNAISPGIAQPVHAFMQPGELGGLLSGAQRLDRVRVEGERDDATAVGVCILACTAKQRLMSAVDAIEITDRDDGGFGCGHGFARGYFVCAS